jgi:hypothetical protein
MSGQGVESARRRSESADLTEAPEHFAHALVVRAGAGGDIVGRQGHRTLAQAVEDGLTLGRGG